MHCVESQLSRDSSTVACLQWQQCMSKRFHKLFYITSHKGIAP